MIYLDKSYKLHGQQEKGNGFVSVLNTKKKLSLKRFVIRKKINLKILFNVKNRPKITAFTGHLFGN